MNVFNVSDLVFQLKREIWVFRKPNANNVPNWVVDRVRGLEKVNEILVDYLAKDPSNLSISGLSSSIKDFVEIPPAKKFEVNFLTHKKFKNDGEVFDEIDTRYEVRKISKEGIEKLDKIDTIAKPLTSVLSSVFALATQKQEQQVNIGGEGRKRKTPVSPLEDTQETCRAKCVPSPHSDKQMESPTQKALKLCEEIPDNEDEISDTDESVAKLRGPDFIKLLVEDLSKDENIQYISEILDHSVYRGDQGTPSSDEIAFQIYNNIVDNENWELLEKAIDETNFLEFIDQDSILEGLTELVELGMPEELKDKIVKKLEEIKNNESVEQR